MALKKRETFFVAKISANLRISEAEICFFFSLTVFENFFDGNYFNKKCAHMS